MNNINVSGDVRGSPPEVLRPLYFDSGNDYLFGCHHEPVRSSARAYPVVICGPVVHEYERCHRALRQLAVKLNRDGFHALRFDYPGMGDSSGDFADITVSQWEAGVHAAIDLMRARTGAERVVLVGLRVGANLAANVITQRDDVAALACWCPARDGGRLLQEWRKLQTEHERSLGYSGAGDSMEILGYRLSSTLKEGIEGLRFDGAEPQCPQLWLEHGHPIHDKGSGPVLVEAADIWRQEALEAVVPMPAIRRLVDWLGEQE